MNRQALSTGCGALAANSTAGYLDTVRVPGGDDGITTGGPEAVVESCIRSVMMSTESASNAAEAGFHSIPAANTPIGDNPDQSRKSLSSDFNTEISLSKMQAPAVRVRELSPATSQVAAETPMIRMRQ